MNPYFSIIIPSFNEEHFIPKLLNNLNSQNFNDFEVIVVDGYSTDKTAEIVTHFKSKYPLSLVSTKVRGVSYARNLGAKKSTGEILIFFDADTQIPKNYLDQIAQAFKKRRPHFLTTYIKVNSQKPLDKIYAAYTNLVFEIGLIIKVPSSYGAMQAVTKKAFFDVGGYDVKTKFGEDGQLFQKLCKAKYKFIILKNPRYIFSLRRFHSEGTIKSLAELAKLNLNIFLRGYNAPSKIKYQMGGHRYKTKTKLT